MDNTKNIKDMKDMSISNLTVGHLKKAIADLPDDMWVIIPSHIEGEVDRIESLYHVRTIGILTSKYEKQPALCLNSSDNGMNIGEQIDKYLASTQAQCEKVLF